jgi:hypothetical protein
MHPRQADRYLSTLVLVEDVYVRPLYDEECSTDVHCAIRQLYQSMDLTDRVDHRLLSYRRLDTGTHADKFGALDYKQG